MEVDAPVEFYRSSERPYGLFSNLARRTIVVRGWTFPTVEHAYQSLKPRDLVTRAWLMAAPSPSILAVAAHVLPSEEADPAMLMGKVSDALLGFHTRPGWSRLRYPWMMECILAKVEQHLDVRQLLLDTNERDIVEAGRIDDDAGRRWGRVNGRGANYLGRMLERARGLAGGVVKMDPDLDGRLEDGRQQLETALRELAGRC